MLISKETDELLYNLHQKIFDTRPSKRERWRNMLALSPEHWCIPTKVWFPSIKLRLAIRCYHEMKTIPMPKMCTSASKIGRASCRERV